MQSTNPPTIQKVLFDPKGIADAPILTVTDLSGADDTDKEKVGSEASNQEAGLLCAPVLHTEVKL